MSKPIPTVQKFMTMAPHSIGADQTLADAHAVLRANQVRHLPVLIDGKLAGMLTDRDLHLIETLRDVDPTEVKVEEAMVSDVYAVTPETPLDEVVKEMARRKYGSAIVMKNHEVLGIFTTIDVCRALSQLLHTRLAD